MRFGVCAGPEKLDAVTAAGADYIECTLTGLNALSDFDLQDTVRKLTAGPVRCEALCILFPGTEIPLTGEHFDLTAVGEYANRVFKRIGPVIMGSPSPVVVLGSGGARRVPEGFDRQVALSQFTEAASAVAMAAEPYAITIALESLNRSESNFINTLAEAAEVVRRVANPYLKMTADIYHMLKEDEPPGALAACRGLLAHTHIATKDGRLCPQIKDRNQFATYFDALRAAGYDGRMSIEADLGDMSLLPSSLAFLREM